MPLDGESRKNASGRVNEVSTSLHWRAGIATLGDQDGGRPLALRRIDSAAFGKLLPHPSDPLIRRECIGAELLEPVLLAA